MNFDTPKLNPEHKHPTDSLGTFLGHTIETRGTAPNREFAARFTYTGGEARSWCRRDSSRMLWEVAPADGPGLSAWEVA